jgi:GT2 family glycosyltransferase
MKKLDVLILHYARPELLRETLVSLEAARLAAPSSLEVAIWVLDNGSPASERRQAKAVLGSLPSSHFRWVESASNLGFARGHNFLLEKASPAGWVLFLNSDTRVSADFFSLLAKELPPDLPRLLLTPVIEEDGRSFLGGRILEWRATGGMSAESDPLFDFASGSALLAPAKPFVQAGGWNPAFFFYGEDVELSARLRGLGWAIRPLREIRVKHRGRGSVSSDRALLLHFRGRRLLLEHLGFGALKKLAVGAVVSAEIAVKSVFWALTGKFSRIAATWRGWASKARVG